MNTQELFFISNMSLSLKKSRVEGDFTEKQLTQDFGVFEYLRENKLTNDNIDNYIRFYDEVLIKKRKKVDRLKQLQDTYARSNQEEPSAGFPSSHRRVLELDDINIRAAHELTVRQQLEKTCCQLKKSLVLLKGDIGHIISRNESEKLLQSKIHKVKIVADDQYNKVYLEYLKDREQKRELSDMQKTFLTKLCSVKRLETNVLTRTRDQFFELMSRQKNMNEKLSNIEQRSLLIKQQVELNKQKNYNNYVVGYLSTLLHRMSEFMTSRQAMLICNVDGGNVREMDIALSRIMGSKDTIMEQLTRIQKEKSQIGPNVNCAELCDRILREYSLLKMKLQGLSQSYSDILCKFRFLSSRNNRNSFLFHQSNRSDHVTLEDSTLALTLRIKSNLKIAIVCLNFFLGLMPLKEEPHLMNRLISLLKASHGDEDEEQLLNFFDLLPQNFTETMKNYVTSLILVYETKDDELVRPILIPKLGSRHKTKNKRLFSEEQNDMEPSIPERTNEDPYIMFHNLVYKAICTHQTTSLHADNHTAKRLKFLHTIDKDYSHMLKETLKMEKDHTRKNHDFQKCWKREKYVNRDAILKERRFQASFSHLWKANQKTFRRKASRNQTTINTNSCSVLFQSPLNKEQISSSFVKSPINTPPVSRTSKWAMLDIIKQFQ